MILTLKGIYMPLISMCIFLFRKHYSSGPAELLFGQQSTGLKGLYMVFDSGSSYTYFSSLAYKSTLSLVRWKPKEENKKR